MSSPHSPRKVHLVGSRIRELRKGRHLTQTELSERIGVAQSDLSRMEQGEYKVGLDARGLVADFQDLSEEARREVRDFVRFKRLQQEERGQDPEEESPTEEK